MLMMHELVVVGSLLMEKHENLIIENFMSQMRVFYEVDKLLTTGIAYGSA